MYVIAGLVLGALLGGTTAKRRGGKGLDIAQYAAVYALIGFVLGIFLTVALNRIFA